MSVSHVKHVRPFLGLLIAAALSPAAWAGGAPNVITVTTVADGMDAFDQRCSLREAVANANTNTAYSPVDDECPAGSGAATDMILLASGASYLLTITGAGNNAGDLDVVDDPDLAAGVQDLSIGITGGNTRATIQQQAAGERVFELLQASVAISDVTVRGGSPDGVGGGILNDGGTLALDGVDIYDNTAISGGGLYNKGDATITNSDVTFNGADLIGGGILHENGALQMQDVFVRGNTAVDGGGLYNAGASVNIGQGSELQDNSASGSGGGVLNGEGGVLVVLDAAFTGNTAETAGGGVHSDSQAPVRLTRTDLVGNEAGFGGGLSVSTAATATITGGQFLDNSATFQGGAAKVNYLEATGTTFHGNSALSGGAILAALQCKLYDSVFTGNTAERGGAAFCQILEMQRTRVSGNSASQRGGGLYVWRNAEIEDSTIAYNVAALDGGGLWIEPGFPSFLRRSLVRNNTAQGDGGGVWVGANALSLEIGNTTISGNATPLGSGSGLYIEEGAAVHATNVTLANNFPGENVAKYGDLTLQNSIITTPGQIDCVVSLDNPEILSLGNNISDDDTCVGLDVVTDRTQVDALLEPLAHTGGNTMTHALLPGSPAIDNGDNAACATDPVGGVDQRNGARDVGLNCDIGAHEQGAVVSLTLFGDGFE